MIYADHAATTKLSERALHSMLPWLTNEYGNPSQPYSFSRKPRHAIAEARARIASCINAKPEEIYFTSGGTESDNWAIKGTAYSHGLEMKLITSSFEHHAVLNACHAISGQGWQVNYVHPNANGIVTVQELSRIITHDTGLVSIMLANNELGTIQPVRELSDISHQYGSIFHTDGVQAVGHIPVDVEKMGIDLLSASAHKFNGPKGVGFLYIRSGTNLVPHENGGAQELGFRAGTENVAGIVGMSVALEENIESLEKNRSHILSLEKLLLKRLSGLNVVQHCSYAPHLPGLLSLSFPGFNGEAILHRMDLIGISISTGSACDSKRTEVSHALRAINLSEELAKGTIRISLGYENTEEDIRAIADGLKRVVTHK